MITANFAPTGIKKSFEINVPSAGDGVYWFNAGNVAQGLATEIDPVSLALIAPGEYKLLAKIDAVSGEGELFDNSNYSISFIVRDATTKNVPDNNALLAVLALGIVLATMAYSAKKK